MRPVFATAPVRRLCVALLLGTAWGLAWMGRAAEPKKTPRLTDAQQEQVRKAKRHLERARKFQEQDRLTEAVRELHQVLAIQRALQGDFHPEVARTLTVLARMHQELDDFRSARTEWREALGILTRLRGEKHWQVTDVRWELTTNQRFAALPAAQRRRFRELCRLAVRTGLLYQRGQVKEAIPLAIQGLAICKQVLGENHPQYATSLHNLGELYYALGARDRAELLWQQARTISRRSLGEKHPAHADTLHKLAELYLAQLAAARGELTRDAFDKIEPLLHQAATIREEVLGAGHRDFAESLNFLCLLYRGMGAGQLSRLGKVSRGIEVWRKKVALDRSAGSKGSEELAQSLEALAELLAAGDDYVPARTARQEILALRTKLLGGQHWRVTDARLALERVNLLARLPPADRALLRKAGALNDQVHRLWQAGKSAEALPLAEQSVRIRRRLLGQHHADYALSLFNLAAQHQALGQYARAEPLYREGLAVTGQVFGKRHPEYAVYLTSLGHLSKATGNYARSEALMEQALGVIQQAKGKEHPDCGAYLNNLAVLCQVRGNYARAESLYRQALATTRRRVGEKDPEYADGLNNLAALHQARGSYTRAESLLIEAVAIYRRALGDGHPRHAQGLNNLADLYRTLGAQAQAEPLYARALAAFKRAGLDRHPHYAVCLDNLALLHLERGAYAEAESLYREASAIYRQTLGEQHPEYAVHLKGLANLYYALGAFPRVEPLLLQVVAITRQSLGPRHPGYAHALNDLALLYQDMGLEDRAGKLLRESLEIIRAAVGEKHPDYATRLNNLAHLYQQRGDLARAERCFRRAAVVSRETLGDRHPTHATALHNLGRLYTEQGKLTAALSRHVRARAILLHTLGDKHPHHALVSTHVAMLHARQGRWGRAADIFDRALRSQHHHARRVLPGFPEAEQLSFLRHHHEGNLHRALLAAVARRHDPGMVRLSAGWLLNGKALSQEVLAQGMLLARAGADRRLDQPFKELLSVRRQLANLTYAPPSPAGESRRPEQLTRLLAREEQLVKQLGRHCGPLLRHPWVELDAVRRALPANAVLIELARLSLAHLGGEDPRRETRVDRYAAWVIPGAGRGEVRLIDLGEAQPIEAAVAAVRQGLGRAGAGITKQGERAAEQRLRRPLEALAGLVLRPLARHIDPAGQWIISPDAALWLVPWAALPLPDGSFALEKHQISYVISGRDLLTPAPARAPGRPLVMADPDFELNPAREKADTRGRLPGEKLAKFARLPGTAAEAKAITPFLQRYAAAVPVVLTGPQALEATFKAARRPRVVVLSTHGFFFPDQQGAVPGFFARGGERGLKLAPLARPSRKGEKVRMLVNPLLRCGLALAGANRRDTARGDADDGILTGLEVVGCDLRGCELVVLSACDTGLGKVNVGEGVAGLRQAFQLAGAQAVVATLWQVPDRETTALMTAFFTHLAAGKGKAEALRRAQLEVIRQRRTRGKAAHPFYWAAFTLTGQW
jgi:CHAT domain-containing protein/tetratricopeptide (TPR) repeat protein